jgi:hypothetical protein
MTKTVIRIWNEVRDRRRATGYNSRLRAEHDWSSAASFTAADHRRAHREALQEGLGGCPYCA